MRILVVADKRGDGRVRPFQGRNKYPGEVFWLCGQQFRISSENRIKIGKKFMRRYGHTRSDGRQALIIETGAWWYHPDEVDEDQVEELEMIPVGGVYLMLGGILKRGPAFEPYYEKENGTRIPVDLE